MNSHPTHTHIVWSTWEWALKANIWRKCMLQPCRWLLMILQKRNKKGGKWLQETLTPPDFNAWGYWKFLLIITPFTRGINDRLWNIQMQEQDKSRNQHSTKTIQKCHLSHLYQKEVTKPKVIPEAKMYHKHGCFVRERRQKGNISWKKRDGIKNYKEVLIPLHTNVTMNSICIKLTRRRSQESIWESHPGEEGGVWG